LVNNEQQKFSRRNPSFIVGVVRMSHSRTFFAALSAVAGLGVASVAHAFPSGPLPPYPNRVVEYFHSDAGSYFYTIDPSEIAAIDSGAAGPGWSKTGLGFEAYATLAASTNQSFPTCDLASYPCVPIQRLVGKPGLGANEHFFTGVRAEAEGLAQGGSPWALEGVAFYLPLPDATGACSVYPLAFVTVPVYRFYKDGGSLGQSRHRYVTSPDVWGRMAAAGWVNEGIAFCAYRDAPAAKEGYEVTVADASGIMDSQACNAPTKQTRSCIAVSNLRVPQTPFSSMGMADEFSVKTFAPLTGDAKLRQNIALPAASRASAATDVFVQLTDWKTVFGLHVTTLSKGASAYSSISPTVRLPDGQMTLRDRANTGYQLKLQFQVNVRTLVAQPSGGSAAYGVASIEYQDSHSGLRFRENVLVYGTVVGSEFVARDAKDGVVIVATTPREGNPYGRGGYGYWWVDRNELAATIAAARTVEPALSSDPDDYFVRSFSVQNEIYGIGEIGMNIVGPLLWLEPIYDLGYMYSMQPPQ
jgi:hypothetical protein